MPSFPHQRQQLQLLSNFDQSSLRRLANAHGKISVSTRTGLVVFFLLMVVLGGFFPWIGRPGVLLSKSDDSTLKWRDYTLGKAVSFAAKNGTVIVCDVSEPYLPFLSNWLISITRQGHQEKVLVIAEDYATLYKVNQKWPGHAVLIPPAPDAHAVHKFGSLGFFNFTSRRPRHLLKILELGYNVMYNDVDMVWLGDPFRHLKGNYELYFTDDMTTVKPLNHNHDLPPPGKKGRTYICSCMLFMRPSRGAILVMKKWIEELQSQPWSKLKKSNDQPAFNWALNKTAGLVDVYLLPQAAFPTGGLYFKNRTWVRETHGSHVIIHNNYIVGFEKKIKRFRDFGLWFVDDHSLDSPLGRLM